MSLVLSKIRYTGSSFQLYLVPVNVKCIWIQRWMYVLLGGDDISNTKYHYKSQGVCLYWVYVDPEIVSSRYYIEIYPIVQNACDHGFISYSRTGIKNTFIRVSGILRKTEHIRLHNRKAPASMPLTFRSRKP